MTDLRRKFGQTGCKVRDLDIRPGRQLDERCGKRIALASLSVTVERFPVGLRGIADCYLGFGRLGFRREFESAHLRSFLVVNALLTGAPAGASG